MTDAATVASDKAQREMEHTEKAKEREFHRYYHQPHHPQHPDTRNPEDGRTASGPDASADGQAFPRAPRPSLATLGIQFPAPAPADDKALTAFAQLGALRLHARRCLISLFDRRDCYILAEATSTLSLETGEPELDADRLCWGTCVFPKEQSMCYYVANLPEVQGSQRLRDLDDYGRLPSLVVNDLSLDNRFKNFAPVVGHPHARFYAGVPIRSPSGHNIGTYCVLDDKPRNGLSDAELKFLKDMSMTVMRHLRLTRAVDDHRRGGIMVRSLGSFAEGKSSIGDLWQDPWESEPAAGVTLDDTPTRHRRQTASSRPGSAGGFQDPFVIEKAESIGSASPSLKSANLATPDTANPGSTVDTPASDALPEGHRLAAVRGNSASSTNEDPEKPEVKALFARAAKMIREATEADGAIFFDAKVSTFGGLVDDEFAQEQQVDLIEHDKHDKLCAILGVSTTAIDQPASPGVQTALYEVVLRHLLRTYAHGQIFNFDEEVQWSTQQAARASIASLPTTLADPFEMRTSSPKRPDSSKSQEDENILKELFPNARNLMLYPLWDSHRDRWFAGAIIWSSDPKRVFTTEQELSYLAAFSNSIMAEVARLDTKLADAAKGDFISSISHELRSPLHGILGCCELLTDTKLDNFQTNMARTIETCGKTLLDTINHVLDFAKINNLTRGSSRRQKKRQSTKSMISPAQGHTNDIMTLVTDVDLSVLTEEVLETVFAGYNFQKTATANMFETPARQSDVPSIAVIVDINKSDNYVFRTQPGAWRRVLMNLFGNALKYTPAGYTKVKLQVIPSTGETGDVSELRLIVTDSGIGMSASYVNNRLFHSFAQENPLSQGTGLGLSIVKQIVESLGGDIEVRSQKDHGTKFTVCCPLKLSVLSPGDMSKVRDAELLAVRKRTDGMKVLFVGFDEDGDYFPAKNPKNKNATRLTLKALDSLCADWFGMHTVTSRDNPDIIVATESGAKWLRAQNSNLPNSPLPPPVIVVCQGAASAHSATAITVIGQIYECIAQPCGPHKLAKALTSCLDRQANRLRQSSEPDIETLNLKDNSPPTSPKYPLDFTDLRPRFTSALSAPEVPSATGSPQKHMRAATPRPLRCLAADDNPINLRLLRTFIDKLHHKHSLATNGLEAVVAFKEAALGPPSSRFDVVLMDINMPEMDGLEATRQIRAHERDAGLKPVTIIALTGLASGEAQQEAHVSGVNLFLIKPVRLGELETVLNGVVVGDGGGEGWRK